MRLKSVFEFSCHKCGQSHTSESGVVKCGCGANIRVEWPARASDTQKDAEYVGDRIKAGTFVKAAVK